MKKKTTKRWLALFAAAALAVSLVPSAIYAEEASAEEDEIVLIEEDSEESAGESEESYEDMIEITQLDTAYSVYIEAYECVYVTFTAPESGYYRFYTLGDYDAYGYLYDSQLELYNEDDDSGEDLNPSILVYLEEGEKCFFGVEFLYGSEGESGSIEVYVEQVAASGAASAGEEDSVTWAVAGDTLTISGSGAMADYDYEESPWYMFVDEIHTVVIGDGVSYIGDNAFTDLYNLLDVFFEGSDTVVSEYAFGEGGLVTCWDEMIVVYTGFYSSGLTGISVNGEELILGDPDEDEEENYDYSLSEGENIVVVYFTESFLNELYDTEEYTEYDIVLTFGEEEIVGNVITAGSLDYAYGNDPDGTTYCYLSGDYADCIIIVALDDSEDTDAYGVVVPETYYTVAYDEGNDQTVYTIAVGEAASDFGLAEADYYYWLVTVETENGSEIELYGSTVIYELILEYDGAGTLTISTDTWAAINSLASTEEFQALAKEYGISAEDITAIVIGEKVQNIATSALNEFTNLASVTVEQEETISEEEEEAGYSLSSGLYVDDSGVLYFYYNLDWGSGESMNMKQIVYIPSSLEVLTVESDVDYICEGVFDNASALRAIYFEGSPIETLEGISGDVIIYYPADNADWTEWTDYYSDDAIAEFGETYENYAAYLEGEYGVTCVAYTVGETGEEDTTEEDTTGEDTAAGEDTTAGDDADQEEDAGSTDTTEDTSPDTGTAEEKADLVTGLANLGDGWALYAESVVVDYTGLVYNDETYSGQAGWYYVVNGYVDFSYTGLVKYDGASNGIKAGAAGWYFVHNGHVDFSYTGLVKYNGYLNGKETGVAGWYYVKNAYVDFTYTGLVKYTASGATGGGVTGWYYVKNAYTDFTYTGLASNAYGTWYVKAGNVKFGYSGTYTTGGTTYTIKSGRLVG